MHKTQFAALMASLGDAAYESAAKEKREEGRVVRAKAAPAFHTLGDDMAKGGVR